MRVIISARLMPAVQVGDLTISTEPTDQTNSNGKPTWRYAIDGANGKEYEGDDLAGWGDASAMLATLCAFLGAAAESYAYNGLAMEQDTCTDMFPQWVCERAHALSDELSMAELDLESV